MRIATGALRPRNDTVNKKRRVRRGEGTPPYAFHGVRCKAGRVVREADPYGGYKGCCGRATARVAPTEVWRGEIFLNFWVVARERATGEATEREGRE